MEFNLQSFKEMARQLDALNRKIDQLVDQTHSEYGSEVMSIDEAAKFLKLTKSTLYKKTSLNEIPFCKTGKVIVFFKKDLVEWLKDHRVKALGSFILQK
ncbi:helix-turn-helix domain-containing protein [Echinicola rosea]|uniref:Helix-turn-helix domain-containing protein n=1 Tax=Echinicola rosea TaxID=1807691 RepID=A0ABQ1VCW8_9BACT|nr:helix-turn-helix domain-containing protein [Echinicola rosea]GGF49187.1 hypothetical protein GCM10011339_42240 [Echinicola rosea]